MATFLAVQDPDAILDWTIDWSEWLVESETIVAAEWTGSEADDITLDSDVFGTTTVTVWVSELVPGHLADATVHITTSGGREDDRTIRFIAKEM